jgi:uncharacterized spore protein YtfJ
MAADRTGATEAAAKAASGRSDGVVGRLAQLVGGHAGAGAVFGEPVRNGDIVVIPVARTRWASGGGEGSASTATDEDAALPSGSGYGSGGGGGAMTDPIGYIEVGPDGAVFRRIGPSVGALTILAAAIGLAIVLRAGARLARA